MLETLKEWAMKLRPNSHRKMERFIMSFSIVSVLMIIVLVSAYRKSSQQEKYIYDRKAYYNTSFITSKSNVNGEVKGIFRSDDYTKAFVLVKFKDIQNVSNDAEDYSLFLTGAPVKGNPITIKNNPAASVYMFGNSGYMGVYLVNQEGFETQILDMVVRNNKVIANDSSFNDSMAEGDKSFAKYDQFRIYFNPGASDAEVIDSLNMDGAPKPKDIYYDTVINRGYDLNGSGEWREVVESEEFVRAELDELLDEMDTNLKGIDEYIVRLNQRTNPLVVPPLPAIVNGDQILEKERPLTDEELQGLAEIVDETDEEITVDQDEVVIERELVSNVDFSRGFNFDWRSGSVKEGYLDELMRDYNYTGDNGSSFLADIQKSIEKNDDYNGELEYEWILADGQLLDDLQEVNPNEFAELNADKDQYLTYLSEYYQAKKEYETVSLNKLLWLEIELNRIASNTGINMGKDILTVY